jgi:hypothetical protein
MQHLKGKCKCGADLQTIILKGFDFIIIGLIIGAIMCFPLGCTYGISQQKLKEMETWEKQ